MQTCEDVSKLMTLLLVHLQEELDFLFVKTANLAPFEKKIEDEKMFEKRRFFFSNFR